MPVHSDEVMAGTAGSAAVTAERSFGLAGVHSKGAMFSDYYEILEVSPNANSDTIDRVFRHLAKRYHPDNGDTGNSARFNEVIEAHATLKDPAKRAQYDVQYKNYSGVRTKLIHEANDTKGLEWDVVIQERLLSVLYV